MPRVSDLHAIGLVAVLLTLSGSTGAAPPENPAPGPDADAAASPKPRPASKLRAKSRPGRPRVDADQPPACASTAQRVEATVVGVVAHELAHLDRGHLYGYVRRSKMAETSFTRAPGREVSFDQFFTQQASLFGLMFNPYRPEHENEADCSAVTWMFQ